MDIANIYSQLLDLLEDCLSSKQLFGIVKPLFFVFFMIEGFMYVQKEDDH